MSRPSVAGFKPSSLVTLLGLVALAAITVVDRGATRMFQTPWSILLTVAVLAPWIGVLMRQVSPACPLVLPPPVWRLLVGLGILVTVASAALSPWPHLSLLWASEPLSAVPWFLIVYDWAQQDPAGRRRAAGTALGWIAVVFVALSLSLWALDVRAIPRGPDFLRQVAETRNPHPLGHSNYTAGLVLLLLPWPLAMAARTGRSRAAFLWILVCVGLVAVMITSGSRGGLLGLGAEAIVFLLFRRPSRNQLALGLGAAALAVALLAFGNPRIRALSQPANPQAQPDDSHVQRAAMARVGWHMGLARPLIGWGPETTPLAYPLFRAGVDGGAENVLQLHSAPIALWAEGGALTLAVALGVVLAGAVAATSFPAAAMALAGYVVFATTDWQVDVPVFAFLLAALLGLSVKQTDVPASRAERFALAGVAVIFLFIGVSPDPAPALNVRALALGTEPAQSGPAVALLTQSLALNPNQEIAYFNRGWLTVTSNPKAAAADFAAASRLVPDKGGVYFGRALAALNDGRPASEAVHWLALECLNDPAFMTAPWWRIQPFLSLHPAVFAEIDRTLTRLATELPAGRWPQAELVYDQSLARWLNGQASQAAVALAANTVPRRVFFSQPVARPDGAGPIVTYHRERTGYPVLMRQPDLGSPIDLYLVQEDRTWSVDRKFLFPTKGWLQGALRNELSLSTEPLKP